MRAKIKTRRVICTNRGKTAQVLCLFSSQGQLKVGSYIQTEDSVPSVSTTTVFPSVYRAGTRRVRMERLVGVTVCVWPV